MRRARLAFPLLAILCGCPMQALACKERVVWPLHILEGMDVWNASRYRVVRLTAVRKDGISGQVEESFGAASETSGIVEFRFDANQEAHAICLQRFEVGSIYLLFARDGDRSLEISRFSGAHVRSDHKKFPVYLADLRAARKTPGGEKK